MKRVAIMTWYHYNNFGTALQVTACYHVLRSLGYQADVIQYIPHGKLSTLKNNRSSIFLMRRIVKKFSERKYKRILDVKRIKNFDKFLKERITLTSKCNVDSELFQLNEKYDAFVCGSDQIWSPSIFNAKYFLDFVQDENRMIAYAPSIGLSQISDDYVRNRMKECIGRFKYLSIREEEGKRLIKEMCNKEALVVLDPTLLLTTKEWDSIATEVQEKEQYILCYFLGNSKQTWKHIKKVSQKLELPIKVIPIFNEDLNRGFDIVNGVGPAEFLGLIKNAAFVCTDSFHGTIFSIMYKRPFYTYERFSNKDNNSQNSRIYNILKLTGLESRLVSNKSNISTDLLKCEFKDVEKHIEVEKKKSINYLIESLHKSTSLSDNKLFYKITNTCCGCGACAVVCKQNAIDIKRSEEGFLVANIDNDKCIDCNLCKKVCPYNGEGGEEIDINKHSLYMARSKDYEVLKSSSSGGIAYEISRMLCTQGYNIIGCAYDNEKGEAVHEFVPSGEIEKLKKFQGSKYLQSNTANIFKYVLNTLDKGVIFGTPCQISGVHKLLELKNKRTEFILVDLICHSVPTQNLWEKYLNECEYKYGLKPKIIFRDKSMGWRKRYIRVEGNGKTSICIEQKDLFYKFFMLGNCCMPACYECAYRTSSAADIRLGDYWGPRYKRIKDGVSMVVVMTDAGIKILEQLNDKNKIQSQKMDCNEYWTVQYPQNQIKPVFYNELLKDLKKDSISLKKLSERYCLKFEFYQKIQKIYSIIYLIYKKAREIK